MRTRGRTCALTALRRSPMWPIAGPDRTRHAYILEPHAMRIGSLVALLLVASGFSVGAQQRASELGPSLLQNPAIRAAVDAAKIAESETIEDQIRLCEVEAPPFQEARRAQLFAQMLRDAGVKNVRLDAEGNVIGARPGQQARPNVVLSAHLDTVFPRGTVVKVR